MLNIANHELLAAALVGYQHQLNDITAKIAEINAKLGKTSGRAAFIDNYQCWIMSHCTRHKV